MDIMDELSEDNSPLGRRQGDVIPENWLPVLIERIEWEPCQSFAGGIRQIDFGIFSRGGIDGLAVEFRPFELGIDTAQINAHNLPMEGHVEGTARPAQLSWRGIRTSRPMRDGTLEGKDG